MNGNPNLEARTLALAGELFDKVGQEIPSIYRRSRWKGKIMESAMDDEELKVRLFRFIDVLPALKSDAPAIKLLEEYFADVRNVPSFFTRIMGRLARTGLVPNIAGKAVRHAVESFAWEFIAGKDVHDSLESFRKMREDGFALSADLLGEEVLSDREADQYVNRYDELLSILARESAAFEENPLLDNDTFGALPRCDVSLKVTSFYSQLDPVNWEGSIERTTKALKPIFQDAARRNIAITIDMEHHHLKDLTIEIFKTLLDELPEFDHGGIVIQAYVKESERDLAKLIEWAGARNRRITIRLVKGAYWDYETVVNAQRNWPIPVFSDKESTDANFERLTRMLLDNVEHTRPGIATHNIRSIAHAMAYAEEIGLPNEGWELQNIYGMAEPVRRAIAEMGYRVRVYTPIGELIPGMAYLIRRLLENTANESFLRKSFYENESIERLTRAPKFKDVPSEHHAEKQGFRNEPLTDFSISENRENMRIALSETRREFGSRYPLFVGGREVHTDEQTESLNPAEPHEIIGYVSVADESTADLAVREARQAWKTWRKVDPHERAEYLFDAAQELRRRRFDLAALEVHETGKTWKEADGDIVEAIDFMEYYAHDMKRIASQGPFADIPGEENRLVYEPRGTAAVIAPWNFPLAISTGMVSAALVTGNCVIYKPSGLSPVTGWRLVEVYRDVGLPTNVLQYLPGSGEAVGEHLVKHPDVDIVVFTGSREVGLRIASLAAQTSPGQRHVKQAITEMGGKNAIIVDESAEPDEAVRSVIDSALGFQGQKCSACSRVIVVGDAYEEFLSRFKEALESVVVGPPRDPGTFMGPLIDRSAQEKMQRYVELGWREGRIDLIRTIEGNGYFVGPVVVVECSPTARIAQEEIFGPIIVVLKADTIDEAISIADNTEYALTGGLHSRSPENIAKVKERFDVGNLYINRKITGSIVGRQPFGGYKMSGTGSKTGGPDYLKQFMHVRCITENTLRRGFAPDGDEKRE